jgi:hypothetical protein
VKKFPLDGWAHEMQCGDRLGLGCAPREKHEALNEHIDGMCAVWTSQRKRNRQDRVEEDKSLLLRRVAQYNTVSQLEAKGARKPVCDALQADCKV